MSDQAIELDSLRTGYKEALAQISDLERRNRELVEEKKMALAMALKLQHDLAIVKHRLRSQAVKPDEK